MQKQNRMRHSAVACCLVRDALVAFETEFHLTFAEAVSLEACPRAGVVHLVGIPGLGVSKEIWVGLGDTGA